MDTRSKVESMSCSRIADSFECLRLGEYFLGRVLDHPITSAQGTISYYSKEAQNSASLLSVAKYIIKLSCNKLFAC
jgi:hypothetical protein